mmetsp:Transcript_1581/g.5207  ORF Transcript_1581/g.5207 Transcript_1581/m.5207 type:complete len:213 (+) Transcript_1581:150-788(+)
MRCSNTATEALKCLLNPPIRPFARSVCESAAPHVRHAQRSHNRRRHHVRPHAPTERATQALRAYVVICAQSSCGQPARRTTATSSDARARWGRDLRVWRQALGTGRPNGNCRRHADRRRTSRRAPRCTLLLASPRRAPPPPSTATRTRAHAPHGASCSAAACRVGASVNTSNAGAAGAALRGTVAQDHATAIRSMSHGCRRRCRPHRRSGAW